MIEIKHDGCDGWALYESAFIAGGNSKNIHVVETKVSEDKDGHTFSTPNSELVTLCGDHLVHAGRSCLIASKSDAEIRSELAKLQNEGHEVCGTCASQFYARPDSK